MPRAAYAFALLAALLYSGGAHAQPQPCPSPTFVPCNNVVVNSLVQVDHSDSRAGYTTGNFIVGGEYGTGTTDLFDNGNRFRRSDLIRSSEYVESTAEAGTNEFSMLARAEGEADLARGTLRARIEGYDATQFPASLMEISQARIDLWLRDAVTFHLPAHYAGGTVQVFMFIDGAIDTERPRGVFGSTEVVAQMNLGIASSNNETKRWVNAGTISDVIALEYELIATASASIDQRMAMEYFLRLSSGDGHGAYAIDFYSTARAGMIVPAGVSWSSDSGVFLSAVPEGKVASYLLVGLGLLLIVVYRRRIASDGTTST